MTDRKTLENNYIQRQKELAQAQERFAKLQNENNDKKKLWDRTEDQIKNLDQMACKVGDVQQVITEDRILIKSSGGSRLVVGCRAKIERTRLKPGTRITMDMSTNTIMGILPREVDPNVHNMQAESAEGLNVGFGDVGGLTT